MQAIILAAGMGKRLGEFTKENTKCMVRVNGVSLIERMLMQINKHSFSRIILVTGYKGERLRKFISSLSIDTEIVYIDNPIYDKTNNIYSLSLVSEFLEKEDTILFESDLIFDDSVLEELLNDPRETLALVDKYESWMDGTCMKIDEDDTILEFVPGSKFQYSESKDYYKTVNIYKFSKHFSQNYYVPFLRAYTESMGKNEYYEQVLRVIAMLDRPEIKAKRIGRDKKWYEIDDVQDLDIASVLFMDDEEEQLALFERRYGGYWRFSNYLDFCYLVNPYFPPRKMIDEIEDNFESLITQYPSGMEVNSLLASRNFGVKKEYIAVGNGASELISVLAEGNIGKMGCIRPTFEEYVNRVENENVVSYYPQNSNFSYDEKDIIDFFTCKDIQTLLLINPDNPSGNYISKTGLNRIIRFCVEKEIRLIVDESFMDFANGSYTLIKNEFLEANKNTIVIKSISKSYGVPGLRLGVVCSGDIELIKRIKQKASIWNINSFAEFYMQIEAKYDKEYARSLDHIKTERERFAKELSKISAIRVIPSSANYMMIELKNELMARDISKRLLVDYHIIVKDLTKKLGVKNYLRIAVRNTEDNNRLLEALTEILI